MSTGQLFHTPKEMEYFRLCTVRSALSLEIKGMKRSRGPSALALARNILGAPRLSKQAAMTRLCEKIEKFKQENGLHATE